MEQRCDTMFEIMNNIVQELNILRRQQNIHMGGGAPVNIINTSIKEHEYQHESGQEEASESEYETDDDEESSYSSDEDLEEEKENPEERVVELSNEIIEADDLKQVQMIEESPLPETTQSSLLDIDENPIKVEKVETTLDNEENNEETESTMDTYKSMTNSALKALVIEKGLSTNPSKLKKSELLDLLKELE